MPTLMTIDEFEKKIVILPHLTMVEPLQRVLLLKEASRFEDFKKLKIDRDLIRFFTKSDSILKFFEELSYEMVSFDDLMSGDLFAEFYEHINLLKKLLKNYKKLLEDRGLTDRAFISNIYRLNYGFIENFNRYELFLEGYLSRFELLLIKKIAESRPFIIHFLTSKFNKKVQERFLELGIEELPMDSFISFDLHSKKIIDIKPNSMKINAKVLSVEERLSQIPILFEEIQNMIDSGIPPEDIAVVLPDEKFKDTLKLYDSYHNLNFAMGFDYSKSRNYKELEAINLYWQDFSEESINLLKKYNISIEKLKELSSNDIVKVDDFFKSLDFINLDLKKEIIKNSYLNFNRLFKDEEITLKSWLFLWLKRLAKLTIDDVGGGKVTVLGALETRGVKFRGLIVLDFNDGIVPAIPAKDNFLNSNIRKLANLPTKTDREALQKQLYKRALEQSEKSIIIYSQSNNRSPASYLYELNLGVGREVEPNLEILYNQPSQIIDTTDPIIKNFNAIDILWSATRLKTFLSCKRKYYYQYEKKLRAKDDGEINEGKLLHHLLEHLFKKRTHFDSTKAIKYEIDRLFNTLLENKNAKIEFSKLLWRKKLDRFIESQIEHFIDGWRVEEIEKNIAGTINGIRFKGVVDRIDRNRDKSLILDYKSGSIAEANRVKNLEKLTDFQMSIYSEILKDKYSNMKLAFIELFNGNIVPITELEAKTKILYEIIDNLKDTKEVVASKCEDLSRCNYCDYTLLCQRGDYL